MKARVTMLVLLFLSITMWRLPQTSAPQSAGPINVPNAVFAQAPSACQFPTSPAASPEQTAWQIFVAAACSTGTQKYPYLTWESWPNQNDVYPSFSTQLAGGAKPQNVKRRFTPSQLAVGLQKKHGRKVTTLTEGPNTGCTVAGEYQGPPPGPPSGRTICEQVNMNTTVYGDGAADFVRQTGINYRPTQALFGQYGAIQFPWNAIEVKADWVQYPAPCPASLSNVWTEVDGNNCYALAGMHIISKLIPNWIWATFEPQNSTSNPNRCVVLGCYDNYGAVPAQTPVGGGSTNISPALLSLMQSANLDPRFQNYRLDGIQTNFTGNPGNSTLLGNSVIEAENAQVPLNQASCITCHNESSIGPPPQCTDGITAIQNLTGQPNPPPPPKGFFQRDFVWSLLLAQPSSCSSSTRSAGPRKRKKSD